MCKKFKFNHPKIWYMHNPTSVLLNNSYKLLCDLDIQTDHLISVRRPCLIIIKKKPCKFMDFAVSADHKIKLKENEKKYKDVDLARELKTLLNMKVNIISIVISAFGTLTKRLLNGLENLEIRERMETIQTTTLFRTTRILKRCLKT